MRIKDEAKNVVELLEKIMLVRNGARIDTSLEELEEEQEWRERKKQKHK